jgi:hypothetical protein
MWPFKRSVKAAPFKDIPQSGGQDRAEILDDVERVSAPEVTVNNHPFPPGTVVGFHPRWAIEVERGMGREPIPSPVASAEVAENGELLVRGLSSGPWTAAAWDGRWRYVDFQVR